MPKNSPRRGISHTLQTRSERDKEKISPWDVLLTRHKPWKQQWKTGKNSYFALEGKWFNYLFLCVLDIFTFVAFERGQNDIHNCKRMDVFCLINSIKLLKKNKIWSSFHNSETIDVSHLIDIGLHNGEPKLSVKVVLSVGLYCLLVAVRIELRRYMFSPYIYLTIRLWAWDFWGESQLF